jgi:hypothetical protein
MVLSAFRNIVHSSIRFRLPAVPRLGPP